MNDFFTEAEISERPVRPCRRAWCRGLCRLGFLLLLGVLFVPLTVLMWLEDKGENSK